MVYLRAALCLVFLSCKGETNNYNLASETGRQLVTVAERYRGTLEQFKTADEAQVNGFKQEISALFQLDAARLFCVIWPDQSAISPAGIVTCYVRGERLAPTSRVIMFETSSGKVVFGGEAYHFFRIGRNDDKSTWRSWLIGTPPSGQDLDNAHIFVNGKRLTIEPLGVGGSRCPTGHTWTFQKPNDWLILEHEYADRPCGKADDGFPPGYSRLTNRTTNRRLLSNCTKIS